MAKSDSPTRSTRTLRSATRLGPPSPAIASARAARAVKRASLTQQPLALQLGVALVYSAVTLASMQAVRGSLYSGRSAAHVWWYGWVTALSTGLGALPMAFCRGVSDWWLGLANGMAAGMMCAASYSLLHEGATLEGAPSGGVLSTAQEAAVGVALGGAFIVVSKRFLDAYGDVKLLVLEGVDMRKAVLLVVVMTLHSFSEGIGIGVSFSKSAAPTLGMLVTTTLAVHNVPEGFAVSVVLVSKGMSVLGACLWSITTSIPQPIMALAAYTFVDVFEHVQACAYSPKEGAPSLFMRTLPPRVGRPGLFISAPLPF